MLIVLGSASAGFAAEVAAAKAPVVDQFTRSEEQKAALVAYARDCKHQRKAEGTKPTPAWNSVKIPRNAVESVSVKRSAVRCQLEATGCLGELGDVFSLSAENRAGLGSDPFVMVEVNKENLALHK